MDISPIDKTKKLLVSPKNQPSIIDLLAFNADHSLFKSLRFVVENRLQKQGILLEF